MKPNFKQMSVPELRKYVLAHRDDMEAIRTLFHHPSLKYQEMPPLVTGDGLPIAENIRIAEEAIKQRVEIDRAKQKQREKAQSENLRQKLEQEIEEKLRAKIELEVEAKLQQKLEREIEDLIGAIAQFLASTSGFSSRLAGSIALLAIRAGIEDFGDFEDLRN